MLTYSDLKQEYRLTYDGDPWGTTMQWWFAVADYLTFEGNGAPSEWQFSPSPMGPDTEDNYQWEVLQGADPQAIEQFGALMHRHARLCEHLGKNY